MNTNYFNVLEDSYTLSIHDDKSLKKYKKKLRLLLAKNDKSPEQINKIRDISLVIKDFEESKKPFDNSNNKQKGVKQKKTDEDDDFLEKAFQENQKKKLFPMIDDSEKRKKEERRKKHDELLQKKKKLHDIQANYKYIIRSYSIKRSSVIFNSWKLYTSQMIIRQDSKIKFVKTKMNYTLCSFVFKFWKFISKIKKIQNLSKMFKSMYTKNILLSDTFKKWVYFYEQRSDNTCCCCLSHISNDVKVTFKCSHFLCMDCYMKIIKLKMKCPMCRRDIII